MAALAFAVPISLKSKGPAKSIALTAKSCQFHGIYLLQH
jgi:hypothetical protein